MKLETEAALFAIKIMAAMAAANIEIAAPATFDNPFLSARDAAEAFGNKNVTGV